MKKGILLFLCMILCLFGCTSTQKKEEQEKIYNGFKDSLLNNAQLISGNIPFAYSMEIEEKDAAYVYTISISEPKVAMSNIQMMILNPEDISKDIQTATIGIFDELNYHMVPNQINEKDGYFSSLQLQGSSKEKDFVVYVTVAWKDSNQLVQYQVFFSFDIRDGKV